MSEDPRLISMSKLTDEQQAAILEENRQWIADRNKRIAERDEKLRQQESQFRDARSKYHCTCHAITGKVCAICRAYMDTDGIHDKYACCSPLCDIPKMPLRATLDLAHRSDEKERPGNKGSCFSKFVTFTRGGCTEKDYQQLFNVITYLRKCKLIDGFLYAFEYQKNYNPHLHVYLDMKPGKYFSDIERRLRNANDGGYVKAENRRGTPNETCAYLAKDIDETEKLINAMPFNWYQLYVVKPYSYELLASHKGEYYSKHPDKDVYFVTHQMIDDFVVAHNDGDSTKKVSVKKTVKRSPSRREVILK